MPIDRFYLDDPLEDKSQVILGDQELHHLAHVTRAKKGDSIELINGRGVLAEAEIIDLKKREAVLSILSREYIPPSNFQVIIAQAIPRANRLDTIVEKGTELGMDALWLFPGMLSEKKDLKDAQLNRVEKILIAATKQSGRLYLPEVKMIPPISEWKQDKLPLFFGDLAEEAPPFLKYWQKSPPQDGLIFCIGPESGLHDKEMESLRALQGIGVKLHQNILRTDTAPLSALSLIAHALL